MKMPLLSLRKLLFIFSLLISTSVVYSQNSGLTEGDIINKAQSFFEKKSYQEALPLFAQLVSVYPENPEYNYKFGVCTLFGDRNDRRRPIRYLTIALRSITDNPELYFHLGIAYYQNEEFADAMKYLNLYLAKLEADSPERSKILEKVNACLNGMNLEHKNIISDIVSKSEFNKDNFHRAYRADEFNGMLILKPEMFISSQDKKSGLNSFVYISEPRNILYFSGFEGNSNQQDIFKAEMTEKGEWGKPEKLPDNINTGYDEAYPIAVNNGLTLYFSSKGHNSLGGYDVYKTSLDTINNTFSEPENLGVGINSPFDDILFIPDKTGQFAYFSTDRDNLNGKVNVYKIRLIENSLEQNQYLAENVIKSKLGEQRNVAEQTTASVSKTQPAAISKPKTVASAKPDMAPAERAVRLKEERSVMNKLADTSYMLVTQTKNLIRDLTNKRDRANTVSEKKLEAAKSLEVKFEEMMASFNSVESEVEFEKMLENSIVLKKEIYQYRKRADQANLIAWNLGKQIKIKSGELETIKAGAGKVQTNSVASKIEDTKIAYLELRNKFNLADTLTDYSDQLISITGDGAVYDIPSSELAFASEMRKAFNNNTLLAATQKANQKQVQEDIPIVIVDKRTQYVAEKPKPKPAIVAKPLVNEIDINSLAYNPTIVDDESLDLDFTIDAITPEKKVEIVTYKAVVPNFLVDETDLEINFNSDIIEALSLVEPVIYSFSDIAIEDEQLEINSNIDMIEPFKLVNPVNIELLADAFIFDEDELEIDQQVDMPEVINVVEPVFYAATEIMIEDESLEISSGVDAIVPFKLVDPVSIEMLAMSIDVDEDELEINKTADAIETGFIAEQVHVDFASQDIEIDELDLEINQNIDASTVIPVVEPIMLANNENDFSVDDENLEINLVQEALEALKQIKQVTFDEQAYAFEEPIEEELEISLEEEFVKAHNVPEIIIVNNFADTFPEDEALEIQIEEAPTEVYSLVQPVNVIAQSEDIIFPDTEDLEINIEKPTVNVYSVVTRVDAEEWAAIDIDDEMLELSIDPTEDIRIYDMIIPVELNTMAFMPTEISDEQLEIRMEESPILAVEAIALTQPVNPGSFVYSEPDESELEIRFNEYEQLLLTMPEQVSPVYYSGAARTIIDPDESDIVIKFDVDNRNDNTLMASADNSVSAIDGVSNVPETPSVAKDVFYLRESVSLANEIENSQTDIEVLRTALTSPDDLEYEELLFAASLTTNTTDKLKIYNTAFVHLDRDWRAFNNAAVTSINIRNLDQAEVYLYQASLLSQDNGKIYNNMGILACYQNDYDRARNYFVTALQLGVNSEYNLQVLKTMTETNSFTSEKLHQEIGEHRYYEVLSDAMNMGTSR